MTTLYIVDWDDTLYPTSCYYDSCGYGQSMSREVPQDDVEKHENCLYEFLVKAKSTGDLIIVTAASFEWYSSSKKSLSKRIQDLLKGVQVHSNFSNYSSPIECKEGERSYKNQIEWKTAVIKSVMRNGVTAVIIGDSLAEFTAGIVVSDHVTNARLKYAGKDDMKVESFDSSRFPDLGYSSIQDRVLDHVFKEPGEYVEKNKKYRPSKYSNCDEEYGYNFPDSVVLYKFRHGDPNMQQICEQLMDVVSTVDSYVETGNNVIVRLDRR